MQGIQLRLRINTKSQLHWREWDDEFIVFDLATGRTHLLDAMTAGVLLCLENGRKSQNELQSELSESVPEDVIANLLPSILKELIKSSLIQHDLE